MNNLAPMKNCSGVQYIIKLNLSPILYCSLIRIERERLLASICHVF